MKKKRQGIRRRRRRKRKKKKVTRVARAASKLLDWMQPSESTPRQHLPFRLGFSRCAMPSYVFYSGPRVRVGVGAGTEALGRLPFRRRWMLQRMLQVASVCLPFRFSASQPPRRPPPQVLYGPTAIGPARAFFFGSSRGETDSLSLSIILRIPIHVYFLSPYKMQRYRKRRKKNEEKRN